MKNWLKKGYFVDVKNMQGGWCVGVVQELEEDNVKIKYDPIYSQKTEIVT